MPFRHVGSGGDSERRTTRASCAALQDDGRIWVAPATIDGKVGLRPCFVNFRTTDDDVRALVDIAVELGRRASSDGAALAPRRFHSRLLSLRNTGLTASNPGFTIVPV